MMRESGLRADTAEKLIQRTDKGLYRAKDLGRNRVEVMLEASHPLEHPLLVPAPSTT